MKLEKSHFTENLVRINALRFNKWVFEPGMLFKSELKWWGDRGWRGERHSGLDLLSYESDDGTVKTIGAHIKVPVIYEGTLVRRIKDFLGYTVFVAHESYEGDSRLYTIYGHVLPAPDVPAGSPVKEGPVIATLPEAAETNVPGHLHIAVALIPKDIPIESFSWKLLNETANIHFFDPLHII